MMYKVVLSASMAAAIVLTPATMARDWNIGTEEMVLADDGLIGDDVVTIRDLPASKVVSNEKELVASGQSVHSHIETVIMMTCNPSDTH
jgi:hypothetical protein